MSKSPCRTSLILQSEQLFPVSCCPSPSPLLILPPPSFSPSSFSPFPKIWFSSLALEFFFQKVLTFYSSLCNSATNNSSFACEIFKNHLNLVDGTVFTIDLIGNFIKFLILWGKKALPKPNIWMFPWGPKSPERKCRGRKRAPIYH